MARFKKHIKTEVLIIGAGPSGLTCAINLKRFGIDVICLEKHIPGGLIRHAGKIENLPYFKPQKGLKLSSIILSNAKKEKIKIVRGKVTEVQKSNKNFITKTNKKIFYSKFLVFACGTEKKIYPGINLTVKKEEEIIFKARGKKIAIIGAGDAAYDYAIALSARKNKVFIINRRDKSKAVKDLVCRAKKEKNIKIINKAEILSIKKGKTNSIKIKNKKDINCDFILPAIGRFSSFKKIKNADKIILQNKSNNRVFAIGDCSNGNFRQLAFCFSDGLKTAMIINEEREYA